MNLYLTINFYQSFKHSKVGGIKEKILADFILIILFEMGTVKLSQAKVPAQV